MLPALYTLFRRYPQDALIKLIMDGACRYRRLLVPAPHYRAGRARDTSAKRRIPSLAIILTVQIVRRAVNPPFRGCACEGKELHSYQPARRQRDATSRSE